MVESIVFSLTPLIKRNILLIWILNRTSMLIAQDIYAFARRHFTKDDDLPSVRSLEDH